jgi:hypothetical protein
MEQRGFFASLFDINFESLITPRLVKVLYVLIMIVIALTAIGFIVAAFAEDVAFGIVTLLVLAPLGALIYLILARVSLELIIVIFKIRESVDQVATKHSPPAAPPSPRPTAE